VDKLLLFLSDGSRSQKLLPPSLPPDPSTAFLTPFVFFRFFLSQSLTFQVVQHAIATIDSQPSPGEGVLVFVSGTLAMDQDNPVQFSQIFNLLPLADGSGYYVLNDIFRLNLALQ
jgi:Nuclear transport factor 2 (NTF2) domain